MNEREIFVAAKNLTGALERSAFLRENCQDDVQREKIQALLEAAGKEDSFLRLPETENVSEPNASETAGTAIDQYKLLEQIGEGGFGVVYMAEQLEPIRRTVAVKVIKPGMDSRQIIARFEAERQALAIMDHPNIAKVLDAGTTALTQRPYFVMELVRGIPITQFCDQHRLSPRQRLELFIPVCLAIQHAHSKGVIHRDIKPGNVLVAMFDGHPVPKVIDFGIAKATGQQLTERTLHTGFGAIVGSIEYMSPEQASFNQLDIDTRSDLYSLGVLLYELLTGAPPLSAEQLSKVGLLESLRAIRETEPPRPSIRLSTSEGLPSLAAQRATDAHKLASMLRGELDWIVMKALEKDRNRRYATVNGFAEDIQRYLTGEPVAAHPPSGLYRLKKLVRRNWRALATATLLMVLVAGAIVASLNAARNRRSQIAAHSALLSSALEQASAALGAAENAPIGREAEWVRAREKSTRLQELLGLGPVEPKTESRALMFVAKFSQADADRKLAEQIENVVMLSATHEDLQSWQRMESNFRKLFLENGIDLDGLDPQEVARRIREHRSALQLSDALELWIGTRGQMAELGGPRLNAEIMQPWAEAMYNADPDPVRNSIRRLIYEGKKPTVDKVESAVAGVQLQSLSPRTLSWLASVYAMAEDFQRSDEVFLLALDEHPSDLMLNFDFAYMMTQQKRWPGAIRYFMRCTAIRPDVAGIWHALGNAYRQNGELQFSERALRSSIKIEPSHAPIHADLAHTLLEMREYIASESSARKAIQLGSEIPQSYFTLGRALMEQAKYAEALVALQRCESLSDQQPHNRVESQEWVRRCKEKLKT